MADPSRAAVRALRTLLLLAVAVIAAGLALRARPPAGALRLAGLWVIALTPFIVLLIVAAGARRARWFALGTIAVVLVGYLLAR